MIFSFWKIERSFFGIFAALSSLKSKKLKNIEEKIKNLWKIDKKCRQEVWRRRKNKEILCEKRGIFCEHCELWVEKEKSLKMSNFQFYESRVFSAILHIIAIGQLVYAMHFDWNLNIPDTPGVPKMLRNGYGGRSRFLTYWCLVSR